MHCPNCGAYSRRCCPCTWEQAIMGWPPVVQQAAIEAERKAREELKRITPPNAELLTLAERSPPPPEWLEGEEEDLFVTLD